MDYETEVIKIYDEKYANGLKNVRFSIHNRETALPKELYKEIYDMEIAIKAGKVERLDPAELDKIK